MAWNVVVAGDGFGGFYAARRLERALPPQPAPEPPAREAAGDDRPVRAVEG